MDVLLSVALNHVPQLPHVARVKDVERLVRMELPVLDVRAKQVVIWTGIPLMRQEERTHLGLDNMEDKDFDFWLFS